jgi:hypothetical protein
MKRLLRGRKLHGLLAVLALTAVGLVAPGQASAANPYNLLKDSYFSATPAQGWSTCLHSYVTLPVLPSNERYLWVEEYGATELQNSYQTFSGKFYWTVCVSSMKGISGNWTYFEYSLLTGVTTACETQGHCTTYEIATHYVRQDAGATEGWGSQLQAVPSTYCSFSYCEDYGAVTVTRT